MYAAIRGMVCNFSVNIGGDEGNLITSNKSHLLLLTHQVITLKSKVITDKPKVITLNIVYQ